ncbi:MAG: hypothetical protein ABH826_04230 [Patescibacteria group bacterium]|nr:hypothetical protein [Patescibacteria group bacterium]
MTTAVRNTKAKWYTELMHRFHKLMDHIGMPDEATEEIKEFMLSLAREQYMAGNRSGIAWMRKKAEEGVG